MLRNELALPLFDLTTSFWCDLEDVMHSLCEIYLFILFIAVPLDKPVISVVNKTCDSVTFSWSHDTKMYVEVSDYQLTIKRSDVLVKIKLVSGNTSQMTFTGLDESTGYVLMVKQQTNARDIGHETSMVINTTKCMFVFTRLSILR